MPDVGSKRGRKSCNDEFYDALPDVRTKKQKQMDLPSNTITSALVHQPALFDRLPIELRRLILPYLDSDPYALLALQLSTKSWYLAMTTGRNTDAEWQRRCISMGAGKRSSGCKTWRQSWIFMMKTRCIVCREPAGIALGAMVPADLGPEWIKVCEICRSSGDHPFICTTLLEGLGNADRESLPYQLRKSKGGWTRECLKSIVDSLVAQRKQERLELVNKVVSGYEGDVDTLRDAVMLVEDKKSKSHLLTKLVQRLLQLPEPAFQDYDSIIQHHHAMLQAQLDLDSSLSLLQPALDSRWRISSVAVFSGPQKEAGSSTWLQAIACKDISASDFVLFQVDRKFSLEKYPLGKFDKFRTKHQACQSKVVCDGKPLGCEHGLCKFHHGPLCKPIVAELVNKVTAFCQEEQYHRELENASKILGRAHADALKLDKAGARILSLLHELIDCKNDDQIQLAIILSRLDGIIDLQAHLEIARRCLGLEEDKVWHINLDDEFKGYYSKGDKGKGDSFTWRRAIMQKKITISDIAHFELECKLFLPEQKKYSKEYAFKKPEQKCSAFLLCGAAPLGCSHGSCDEHHFEPCEDDIAQEK